jgi:hypothetical protein
MSQDTIYVRSQGQYIVQSWINLIRSVLIGDIVPRNANGIADDELGQLGTEDYFFKSYAIAVGDLGPGDIEFIYDYDGTVTPLQGWMLCDGRVINESNYNTEHGAGSWDTYIVSSVLENKYLPNLTSKYLRSNSTTATQAGTSAITAIGNASNQINLQHNHSSPVTSGNNDATYTGTNRGDAIKTIPANTHTHDLTIPNALSTTQDIKPESLVCKVYMRII